MESLNNSILFQSLSANRKNDPNEDIEKSQYLNRIDKIKAHVEDKNHFQNFKRYLQTQRQDYDDHFTVHKKSQEVALWEKNLQQDKKLARELVKLKQPEIRDAKLR